MILIRTYKDMTSGEKRSLTLSMKKYADAFAEKHKGDLSSFASEADVIDTFYAEWLKDSLDSHYAWCSEKNEDAAGYTAKGYHEQAGFAEETKAKALAILTEKLDMAGVQQKAPQTSVSKQPKAKEPKKVEAVTQTAAPKKTDAEKRKAKRKNASKLGRNDVCPCGSGKKYKKCCLEAGVEYTQVRGKFVATS
ncbi:SEC-C metal-binding domain-containing protein [Aneurinibacillus sp. REN35]|uniref:SEC-C metal-binding domain-containing protein n=2 Tax=Paenibacillaceae TaxID=186822 RepID=UPI0035277EAC